MAQKTSRRRNDRGPSKRELRRALRLLLHIAFLYETRPGGRRDPDASRMLTRLVEETKKLEARLFRAHERAVSAELARRVTSLYREIRDQRGMPADEQELRIQQILKETGVELPKSAAMKLVAQNFQIARKRGPTQCAKQRVAKVVGKSWRRLHDHIMQESYPWPATIAFGRRAGSGGLLTYVRDLLMPRRSQKT